MARTATVHAYAKINLYLHVTGRRADGYHLLDSLVAFADAGDVVSATAADHDTLRLTASGPFADALPPPEDNIVLSAAATLRDRLGVRTGVDIHLEKNLPPASGIGGGSADAAATLKALLRLWGDAASGLKNKALSELALRIGADVPVCLAGRATRMSGIGETLSPVDGMPEAGIVLVNPRVPVSTPLVFGARTGAFTPEARLQPFFAGSGALATFLKTTTNDLQEPAIEIAPEIAAVLRALETQQDVLLARMSGSGATCFGLFETPEIAREAAARVASDRPDWWVHGGRLLDRT